ncbi:hypothetical protein [Mycobacterium attenuatum]|uniref:hypothetical protein n=1 Tax=Mycobacterium attenuatum TaxID=2341086 RepID=UPI000F027C51|nr:hypothetical protein [Mycobacterium attenuatum]
MSKIIVNKIGGALVGRAHRIVEAAANAEPPHPTDRAFTAVVCGGCGTEQGDSPAETVVAALRDVVRQCPLGVLVTVPCMFGDPCPAWLAEGVFVALQPCTIDREPTCSAHLVGPIRDPEDIAQLSAWVRAGRWNAGLLPVRLRRNAFHRR